MFRVKKKKTNENARKSKDLKPDNASLYEDKEEIADDKGKIGTNLVDACKSNPEDEHNGIVQVVQEQHILSQKKRIIKTKKFSYSNRTNNKDERKKNISTVEEHVTRKKTLLSFVDEHIESPKKRKRKKMRSAEIKISATTVIEDKEVSDSEIARNDYSLEGIETLRKEQKLAPLTFMENTRKIDERGDFDGQDIDNLDIKGCNEEEEVHLEGNEEYIPLHSKIPKQARNKNRVTFGPLYTDDNTKDIPLETEVEEPIETLSGDDLDMDKESREWEDELIRRGGHHIVYTKNTDEACDWENYPKKQHFSSLSVREAIEKVRGLYDESVARSDRYEGELARFKAEARTHEQSLVAHKNKLVGRNEEYEYFRGMKDYVSGLSFCLREKAPMISESAVTVLDQRNQKWRLKKQEYQLMRQAAITYMIIQLEVPIDHFKQCAEVCNESGEISIDQLLNYYNDGYQDEGLRFHEAECGLETELSAFFDDVISEFSDLESVCKRLREWKNRFPQIYEDTYCETMLPKLYSPYVAAELHDWDPLSVAGTFGTASTRWSFENDFHWLQILRSSTSTETPERNEKSDQKLLAEIFSQVVLPKIKSSITLYAEPCSRLHGKSIQYLVEGISRIWKDDLQPLEELVLIWVKKICDCAITEVDLIQIDTSTYSVVGRKLIKSYTRYQLERFFCLIENGIDAIYTSSFFDANLDQESHGKGKCLVIDSLRPVFQQLSNYIAHIEKNQNASLLSDVENSLQKIRQGIPSPQSNLWVHENLVAMLSPMLLRL